MLAQNVVIPTGHTQGRDVGTPQAVNLDRRACHSIYPWGMVTAGRAKSALIDNLVLGVGKRPQTPQERWRRGCRRADVLFWSSQFWQHWLLAHVRNQSKSLSRFRLSRPTPANSSDLSARAPQLRLSGPAPHARLCAPAFNFPDMTVFSLLALWGRRSLSALRLPLGPAWHRGPDAC